MDLCSSDILKYTDASRMSTIRDPIEVLCGLFIPQLKGNGVTGLDISLLGAMVMSHNQLPSHCSYMVYFFLLNALKSHGVSLEIQASLHFMSSMEKVVRHVREIA